MIYFTTGANGAGKTLLTLWDVRQQQLKESRPVYFNGFDMDPAKAAEFGWQKFEPAKWQELPDGSICIFDECQADMPAGKTAANEPKWVQDMAVHRRKRGFDFWLISPHPSLVSPFVRRLVGTPSWHRHLKRTFGADLVSEIKFGTPDLKCEEPGAAERGTATMVPYRKEVYTWYRSASLHTGKRKIPRQVFVLAAAALLVPVLGYMAFSMLPGGSSSKVKPPLATAAPAGPSTASQTPKAGPMTAIEYVASHTPRLPGLPHTAPRYDVVTAPTEAPYPAACVLMADKCNCYTQQATKLQTPDATCRQIVAGGFFMDWKQPAPPPSSNPQPVQADKPAPAAVEAEPAPA
jgi:zona occludens toxin